MAKAVLKNGQLLLPHDVGCGASVIPPDDPRYQDLYADAVVDEDLNGSPDEAAAIAQRWRGQWAREARRTA